MSRKVQFFGILALIIIVFGLLCTALLAYDDFYLVPIHLFLGALALLIFVIGGGLQLLRTAAAKRAVGFGAGVTVYSALFIGLLVMANYFAARHEFLQYDSTEEKVYTLAPQSKEVLENLKKPVLVRAFYVGKIDAEAETLLNRISKASDKFRWQWIDPEKNPAMMEKYGISQSATLHFSFDTPNSKRETKLVRDINEQEVINALLKLTRNSEKTLYYLSGHGEGDLSKTGEAGFLFLKEAIEGENVTVKKLSWSEQAKIPEDASALLILAPHKALLPAERAAIEDYLKGGGNALFLNEPRTTDDIADLVRPLGISVGKDLVVDQVVRMFAGPGLGVQPMVTNYGIHPSTKGFTEGTVYSTVSSVTKAANIPQDADVTELAFTSANSWAEKDVDKIFGEQPTASLDPEDIRGPVSIAAAFEGVFPKGHFQREGEQEKTDGAEAAEKKVRVAVIGDTDFVANVNIRQLYNADFFLNVLNWVLGQDQGVTIRARNLRKSVKVLSDEQFSSVFILTGILFPELLLTGGLGVWWFRKR
jgi:ABC-type uncharacterized transport system involved in gliding motility auxiliary subunit